MNEIKFYSKPRWGGEKKLDTFCVYYSTMCVTEGRHCFYFFQLERPLEFFMYVIFFLLHVLAEH